MKLSKFYGNKELMANPVWIQEILTAYMNYDVEHFTHMYDLYKGEHEILNRTVSDINKPNNHLINDFYGYIIDTTIGYFLGNQIDIKVGEDKLQEGLDRLLEGNYRDDLFMEVGKEMCIKGNSAVLVYQDEASETRLLRVPKEKVIFVYDENNTIDVIGAVRFYTVTETGLLNNTVNKTYVEVYTDQTITYYFMTVLSEESANTLQLDTRMTLNPAPHIYGAVPIIDFPNNEEGMSDLYKIESLVDDYDRIISDSSNEHEAYRNAYLMIRNMVLSDDALRKLKEEGVIEVDDDGDVKFVTKDIQATATQTHLDRLSSNIFKFAQTPDLSDEKFAGNLSGVAIKFKMFGLETKCIIKERKMKRAIKSLLEVLSVPLKITTGQLIDILDVKITFTRNLPANITEIVDTVTKLNGMVDKETLLQLLPFVDNTQDVIDKLEEEANAYSADIANANKGTNLFDKTGVDNAIAGGDAVTVTDATTSPSDAVIGK